MKNLLLIIVTFTAIFQAFGQTFTVDTLIKNGSVDQCINIVILGDGYTASEQAKFRTDAQKIADFLFTKRPWKEYKKYFNVFGIEVISNASGAKHPGTTLDSDCPGVPIADPDNYFNSSFDNNNIHRLIVAKNSTRIAQVLAANFPAYDQAVILVNTPYYGGAGGTYITMGTHTTSGQTLVHEMGHSFANLGDEYWAGDSYARERPNMTKETNPAQNKWRNWLGDNEIGIYQHGTTGVPALWYRPHQNCVMRYSDKPACSVCTETIIERIHQIVSPLLAYSPTEAHISISTQPAVDFLLELLLPEPNTFKTTWTLNDQPLALPPYVDSLRFQDTCLTKGTHILKVTIEDTTELVRVNYHAIKHFTTIQWEINNTNGILVASSNQLETHLHPNPAVENIELSLSVVKPERLSVEILSVDGKLIQIVENQLPFVGTTYRKNINISSLNKGMYLMKIQVGKMVEVQKFIKL